MNSVGVVLMPLRESLPMETNPLLLENDNPEITEDSGAESFAQVIFGYFSNSDEDSVLQETPNKDLKGILTETNTSPSFENLKGAQAVLTLEEKDQSVKTPFLPRVGLDGNQKNIGGLPKTTFPLNSLKGLDSISHQVIEENEEVKNQKNIQKIGGDLNGEIKELISKFAIQSQGLSRVQNEFSGNLQKDHLGKEEDSPLGRIQNTFIKTSLDKNPEFSLNENGRGQNPLKGEVLGNGNPIPFTMKSEGLGNGTQLPITISSPTEAVPMREGPVVSFVNQEGPSRLISQEGLMNQVIEKAVLFLREGSQEIRIKLVPENLGTIKINIIVQDQVVRANLLTENPLVKEILEANQERLKNMLADQGLKVDKFSVEVEDQTRGPEKEPFQLSSWENKNLESRENSEPEKSSENILPSIPTINRSTGIDFIV